MSLVMSYYFYNTPSMADLNTTDKTAPVKTLIEAVGRRELGAGGRGRRGVAKMVHSNVAR